MDRLYLMMVLVAIILLSMALLPSAGLLVYADEDEGEDEEERGGEGGGEFAKSLGELAWSLGPVLIVAFAIYKHTLPYQARLGLKLPIRFKHVLDIHIYSSILLGLAALTHGYLLLDQARSLEYLVGFMIVFILTTGALLRWSRDRRVKIFARLIHAQRLLAIILLILVIIHTSTIED